MWSAGVPKACDFEVQLFSLPWLLRWPAREQEPRKVGEFGCGIVKHADPKYPGENRKLRLQVPWSHGSPEGLCCMRTVLGTCSGSFNFNISFCRERTVELFFQLRERMKERKQPWAEPDKPHTPFFWNNSVERLLRIFKATGPKTDLFVKQKGCSHPFFPSLLKLYT